MPYDREKFNTDPKHEAERTQFDSMVEDSLRRVAAKNKDKNPPATKTFVDEFLEGVFGKGG